MSEVSTTVYYPPQPTYAEMAQLKAQVAYRDRQIENLQAQLARAREALEKVIETANVHTPRIAYQMCKAALEGMGEER